MPFGNRDKNVKKLNRKLNRNERKYDREKKPSNTKRRCIIENAKKVQISDTKNCLKRLCSTSTMSYSEFL